MVIKLQTYGYYVLPFLEQDKMNLERVCRISFLTVDDLPFYKEIAAKSGVVLEVVKNYAAGSRIIRG